jgi:hypothetical protein
MYETAHAMILGGQIEFSKCGGLLAAGRDLIQWAPELRPNPAERAREAIEPNTNFSEALLSTIGRLLKKMIAPGVSI